MKRLRIPLIAVLLTLSGAILYAQIKRNEEPIRLPDGRSQTEEILKADHEKSLKDAADLFRLAEEVKMELEKNDRHVLSVGLLKKTEEIEKIAKRLRSRMKRY